MMKDCDKEIVNQVPKRSRIKYSKQQVEVLERVFEENHYPDTLQQEVLAMDLKVSLDRVSIWFQNRRSKFKRQRQTEHMAWMRKQVFADSDFHTDLATLSTPRLSVLTPKCNVISPIEKVIARSDVTSTPQSRFSRSPGPKIEDKGTPVSPCSYLGTDQTSLRHVRRHQSYWNQGTQVRMNQHTMENRLYQQFVHTSPQIMENRPNQQFVNTPPSHTAERRESHCFPTEHRIPPLLTSYVPSMHSISLNHVPRTPFADVMVNSQPRYEQPTSCVEDHPPVLSTGPLKLQTRNFGNEEVDQSIMTSSPSYKLFDSDSDDSPTKDLTEKLLSKWC